MLRHIGCTAGSQDFAGLVGDEIEFRRRLAPADLTSKRVMLPAMFRHVVGQASGFGRVAAAARLVAGAGALQESSLAVCEVAQLLAARLGFGADLRHDIAVVYERYDGKGFPSGVPGDEVSWPARVVQVAEAATLHHEIGGTTAAVDTVRARRRGAYHPEVVDPFCADAASLLAGLDGDDLWNLTLDAEPGDRPLLDGDRLDEALRAMGDFADLKSPYLVGHSTGVADLASAAAAGCGLPAADVTLVRRAGWVHDLGRVAVSAQVWGSPGALTRDQREQVRLHPYYTERILDQSPGLRPIAALASTHHERMDASGYHRGSQAGTLPPAARILAAADMYHALTEDRPHRAPYAPDAAAKELRGEVRAGRLDADAVTAVLAAAGHRVPRRRTGVAGLTPRELEVLRLVARGRSTREIASELVLSHRTVEHHIENIYTKAGVRTRAAAAAFALQHRLVDGSWGVSPRCPDAR
jgi:HD-GYP domain-containing protein (c-di-GMP phosphodiesterase class II)